MLNNLDRFSSLLGTILSILWKLVCLTAVVGYIESQTGYGAKAVKWCKDKLKTKGVDAQ